MACVRQTCKVLVKNLIDTLKSTYHVQVTQNGATPENIRFHLPAELRLNSIKIEHFACKLNVKC